jgi:hypothetical protein
MKGAVKEAQDRLRFRQPVGSTKKDLELEPSKRVDFVFKSSKKPESMISAKTGFAGKCIFFLYLLHSVDEVFMLA